MTATATNGRVTTAHRWPRVGSFSYLADEDRWEWSDAVAQMHGYQPGTVTPTTELVLSHKHPDEKPTVVEVIDQVRRHRRPFSSRHRIIAASGAARVVVVVGDCCFDSEPEIAIVTGFYIDVTDEFDADLQHSIDKIIEGLARSRAVINQAIGILMVTYGVSADRAFRVLAWRSSECNVKLRALAAQFVSDIVSANVFPAEGRGAVDRLLLCAHARMTAEQ